ncbi:AbrB family transcriptional regulator [Ferrovibrio sp. MS7]|uniref:AbrB family transcriptional regulator n=1 Tax=Ferrovibrio plantarum TaxID=3119164 RepID=UPI001B3CCD90|nr:AbrB family transcriptional regulator [Ferrovibrio sp.]
MAIARPTPQLTPRLIAATAFTLGVGAVGGALFLWLRVPLAWMLGAMCFVAPLALFGRPKRLPVFVDMRLRELMVTVLGVMLGSAFTPEMLRHWSEWLGLMALMLVYVPIATAVCYWVFRKGGNLDPVTSYFAATPGGLQEMTMVGEAMGGNARSIVLCHAIRIFVTVMTIPFYFRLVEGFYVPPMTPGPGVSAMALDDGLLLVGCGLVGWALARRLKLPASQLLGPMICSAFVHLMGWSAAKPPPEIVAIAQVVVGCSLGCRFAGTALREVGRLAKLALISTLVMIALAVGLTTLAAGPLGFSRETLILVLAPGGLAEMSLVALALGVEVAIVSSMHVFRIMVVVVLAPQAFRLFKLKAD